MFSEPAFINVSSTSEAAVALDAGEPNSDFEVFMENMSFGGSPIDIALYSISLNVAPNTKAANASDLLDVFVLAPNVVLPSLRIGTQRTPALAKLQVSQKNERQVFEFGDKLQWQRCTTTSLNRIRIQLATDTFQRTKGAPVELHSCHTPTADNDTQVTLCVRPSRPVTGE